MTLFSMSELGTAPRPLARWTHPRSARLFEQHEKHHERSYDNAYWSGDIGCDLHQTELQRVEFLGMCPHMEKLVACMEVCLESVEDKKN